MYSKGNSHARVDRLTKFAKWVLNIGDGKIDRADCGEFEEDIETPEEFCNPGNVNSVDDMIESTFPDLQHNF